ncbi:hypothetical protein HY498_03505 [Candidatus Woesearchaeota archaeon]|nr:hypothetical protein [Candidatus Woesearchaeota archaeon]
MKNKILIPILFLIFSNLAIAEAETTIADNIKVLNNEGVKPELTATTFEERGEIKAKKDFLGNVEIQRRFDPKQKKEEGVTVLIDNKLLDDTTKVGDLAITNINLVDNGKSLKIMYKVLTGIDIQSGRTHQEKEIFIPLTREGLKINLERLGNNLRIRYESSLEEKVPVLTEKGIVKGLVSKEKVFNLDSARVLLYNFGYKNQLGEKDYSSILDKLIDPSTKKMEPVSAIEYIISPEGVAEIIDVGPFLTKQQKEKQLTEKWKFKGNAVFKTSSETKFKKEIPILELLATKPGAKIETGTAVTKTEKIQPSIPLPEEPKIGTDKMRLLNMQLAALDNSVNAYKQSIDIASSLWTGWYNRKLKRDTAYTNEEKMKRAYAEVIRDYEKIIENKEIDSNLKRRATTLVYNKLKEQREKQVLSIKILDKRTPITYYPFQYEKVAEEWDKIKE